MSIPGIPPKPPGKRPVLKVNIPQEESHISFNDIKTALLDLELKTKDRFVKRYEKKDSFLTTHHPGAEIEYQNISEGETDTRKILIKQVPCYVLKKVSLPQEAFCSEMLFELSKSTKKTLPDQLWDILYERPLDILVYKKPYFYGAQLEYLAYVIGKGLGVPETVLLEDEQGVYSLHAYTENKGSATEADLLNDSKPINVQSLQNIVMLDLILENQDRNPGNILVTEKESELVLTPIDHALSFQYDESKDSIHLWKLRPPCWNAYKKWLEMSLTQETRDIINQLNADGLLNEAEQSLNLDESIKWRVKNNIDALKKMANQVVTTEELFQKWLERV